MYRRLKQLRQAKSIPGKGLIALLIISGLVGAFLAGYYIRPSEKETIFVSDIEQALVYRVIDGDTVVLEDGRTIRYLGIDTPESGDPYGSEATEKNRELVEGKSVELMAGERDVDEYGRQLRYVFVDGTFVNAELVAQGFAKAFIFDPDDRFSQILVQLEQYAKMGGKGVWSATDDSEAI